MLKYTPEGHPDFDNLNEALEEIKSLADRMNKGEVEADQAEKDIEKLRDIEQTIEGTSDLVSNARKFIRQDLVAESTKGVIKKDRCLFLFSDLLVCTTVKRKNHVLRRNSLFTGQSTPEFNRYKFLWKVNLEDVEVSKGLLLFKFRICFHFFTLSTICF
jgi:RhoGEF domain.